jgi:hypothetical protein
MAAQLGRAVVEPTSGKNRRIGSTPSGFANGSGHIG